MRIRLVITNAPPLVGGLEKVCLRLAQQLQKRGHEVEILGRFTQGRHKMAGFFRDTEKPGVIECEGVKVRTITLDARAKLLLRPVFKLIWRESTFPLARWLYIAAMGGQMRSACEGSDVIHYFGVGREMLGFAAADAVRSCKATYIVEPALHQSQWGDRWIDALLYNLADRVVAHSRHEAGALEKMGICGDRISTAVHGVDFVDDGDGAQFRGKHGIAGPMVLFLGRKTEMKGVLRLLDAWRVIEATFPEATLVFAGPGKGKEGLLEKLKSGKRKAEMMADGGWRIAEGDGKLQIADGKLQMVDGRERIAEGDMEEETGDRWERLEDADERTKGPKGERRGEEEEAGGGERLADGSGQFAGEKSGNLEMAAGAQRRQVATQPNGKLQMADGGGGRSAGGRILDLDDLTEAEKQDALAACDVLCVPSEGESFGMVYFEAWAYKKPVVALDLPVLRETVGAAKGGLLSKPDPASIAEAIMQLLGEPEARHRMGENGYRLACRHRWETATDSYLGAYEQALPEKGRK